MNWDEEGPLLELRPARQFDIPENPWKTMDRAPKDCTWIEVKSDLEPRRKFVPTKTKVYVAHWAQDLSGEEQPPFSGWFEGSPFAGGYSGVPDPYCWRPLIP